jgi:hypothetical protein
MKQADDDIFIGLLGGRVSKGSDTSSGNVQQAQIIRLAGDPLQVLVHQVRDRASSRVLADERLGHVRWPSDASR